MGGATAPQSRKSKICCRSLAAGAHSSSPCSLALSAPQSFISSIIEEKKGLLAEQEEQWSWRHTLPWLH